MTQQCPFARDESNLPAVTLTNKNDALLLALRAEVERSGILHGNLIHTRVKTDLDYKPKRCGGEPKKEQILRLLRENASEYGLPLEEESAPPLNWTLTLAESRDEPPTTTIYMGYVHEFMEGHKKTAVSFSWTRAVAYLWAERQHPKG